MQELTDSTAIRHDAGALRARLDRDSYLFFRGLLDPSKVLEVRAAILDVLADDGWLDPDAPRDAAIPSQKADPEGKPDPVTGVAPSDNYLTTYGHVQHLQQFHELAIETDLVGTVATIIGEDVFAHPMKIARLGVPTPEQWSTPAHQDFPLIQGTVDVLTAWVPFGDCPHELGALRVLTGSHRAGLRPHQAMEGVGGIGAEADVDDPRWSTVEFQPGDVLLFHSLTVHGATPNTTNRIRLSGDFRFQSVNAPLLDVWIHPHYGPSTQVPDFDELTRGWTSRRSIEPPAAVTLVPVSAEPNPGPSTLVTVE